MQVLYVEDDIGLAESVQLMLQSEGHVCHAAEVGEEAVALAQANDYDLILLDIMLPDIDGYEVIERVRAAGVTAPVLIQSGLADPENKRDGLGFGFEEYLIKPFNKKQLISSLDAVLAQADRKEGNFPTPLPCQNMAQRENAAAGERRHHRRFETRKSALMIRGDNRVSCIVLNMSQAGAALKLPDGAAECPSRFKLNLRSGPVRDCKVCWRHADKLGVRFV